MLFANDGTMVTKRISFILSLVQESSLRKIQRLYSQFMIDLHLHHKLCIYTCILHLHYIVAHLLDMILSSPAAWRLFCPRGLRRLSSRTQSFVFILPPPHCSHKNRMKLISRMFNGKVLDESPSILPFMFIPHCGH